MFNTSVIPYIPFDVYLTPNLYTIPKKQNMRFFCCSVYLSTIIVYVVGVDFQKKNISEDDRKHAKWHSRQEIDL